MRFGAVALAFLIGAFGILPSLAGDGAARKVLGFSPDGSRFAFAQSGSQDGSGYAYADVFVIDTRTDTYASEPIRVVLEKEGASQAQALQEAMRRARPALTASHIVAAGRRVGLVAASQPDKELVQPDAMKRQTSTAATLALNAPELGADAKVTLTQVPLDEKRCSDIVAPARPIGLALTLTRGAAPPRVLHRDAKIPEGRNCPLAYGLSEVYLFVPDNGPPVLAVLVEYFPLGFEGPDRRFLAVTAQLAK